MKSTATTRNPELVKNPELFIGLVGPIGVDLDAITNYLDAALHRVGYKTKLVHITDLMKEFFPKLQVNDQSYSEKYKSLIKNADNVRRTTTYQSALASLAITEIKRLRNHETKQISPPSETEEPALGTAYIIRQFKREEEIDLMRRIYGRKFIQVSVYLDKEERKQQLIKKIKGHGTEIIDDDSAEKQAIDLISIDNNEVSEHFGQRVSDVFHHGDVFVIGKANREAESTVERFVQALFGHNGYSPSKTEYGMYAAAGAALRSLDLSRQVGAAVFSRNGEVITLGCNEVPKAFGGTYWSDDHGDKFRDFEEGVDGNHTRKLRVVHDLVERLNKLGLLSDTLKNMGSTAQQVRKLLEIREISDSRVMDLIEFGRIIHAEMSAITDAARVGKSLSGSTLFCTTFPCHMCAKHIVSSGIRRVVFLEPYPKSHAMDLHEDSITFSNQEADRKVLFEPFIGISPRRYRDIFEKKKRKDANGSARDWYEGSPAPRIEDRSSSYLENEAPAISMISAHLGSDVTCNDSN
ncbi:deoxycytidylate deaminase [Nitratireductor sp. B36]|uniref:anti-phage dCTP deaminase n=1 Tax=Nitratireductor sp. B36 TaxID=2762059 RepID=UPI001E564376|nr:anti-phage dCTP deaminase [Nitratireductor sp. B36]MCC5777834.1 deoxycytidylate deaminase [Nitratireductor sp. B36]